MHDEARDDKPPKETLKRFPAGYHLPRVEDEKKAALDVALAMRESAVERFNARRNLEWKLAISIWGGVVLAANALKGIALGVGGKIILAIIGFSVFVFHLAWERKYVIPGARDDRNEGIDWSELIHDELGAKWHARGAYIDLYAHYWQVGITLLLILVAAAVVLSG